MPSKHQATGVAVDLLEFATITFGDAQMGPLAGYKVVELAGIGPAPFCAMLLADMGAEVLRIDRVQPSHLGIEVDTRFELLARGRRSVALDLKHEDGIATVLSLVKNADALIEGFRPGVMERLGLGPDVCTQSNAKLVYGRVTGWGQEGMLAKDAGHDLNYIALAGMLGCIGEKDGRPLPPLNLVGDFGGGAMFLAFGIVCALLEANRSGKGQVVDAAMVDGAAYLGTMMYGFFASGIWDLRRGTNVLDSGAPYYDTYETADGLFISIAAIEPKFYANLLKALDLEDANLPAQHDKAGHAELREVFAAKIKTRTRDEWCDRMQNRDICFAPVLSLDEVASHPHNTERSTFLNRDGVVQPAPAPRFSRTEPQAGITPVAAGCHTREALIEWGLPEIKVDELIANGVAVQNTP